MNDALPQRTQTYRGSITDTARWDHFRPRRDDLFVCAPAKCGSTWTQAICALLIFGRSDLEVNPAQISPWLDATITPLEPTLAMLDRQTHRRVVKTHTPLDGIPYYEPPCAYLVIYRDPRDAFLSLRNHVDNMVDTRFRERGSDDPAADFRTWVTTPRKEGAAEQFSLEDFVYHFRSFWRYRALPNVHLLHYSDLRRDLEGNMRRLAAALQIPVEGSRFPELARAASFDHMRKNAATFAPGAGMGFWKDETRFFHRGRGGQWLDVLGPEELSLYRNRLAAWLAPDEIRWLEEGR